MIEIKSFDSPDEVREAITRRLDVVRPGTRVTAQGPAAQRRPC